MQRRQIGLRPIASLVQADAGGIEEDLALVLHNRKAELMHGARLRQPGKMIVSAKPVHRSFFCDGLAVWHGVQLAVQTIALDGEGVLLADEGFQGDLFHALVEVLKAVDREPGQQDHDPLAHPAAQVGPGDIRRGPFKKDAPVLDADVLHLHPAHFIADQPLQPKQGGDAQGITLHNNSILPPKPEQGTKENPRQRRTGRCPPDERPARAFAFFLLYRKFWQIATKNCALLEPDTAQYQKFTP